MSERVLALEGALTMQQAQQAKKYLARGREEAAAGDLLVDFSGVTEADSAALALLLCWLRVARAAGHGMGVRALPPGLHSLAALYGIAELLPLER